MEDIMLLIFILPVVHSLPVYTGDFQVEKQTEALLYLTRYGYIHYGNEPSVDELSGAGRLSAALRVDETRDTSNLVKKAVMEFQSFAGLAVTGLVDAETAAVMKKPRCGVKDIIGFGSRYKRYTLQGSRWKTSNLTYFISKYPRTRRLSKEDVDTEVVESFRVWEQVSNLKFTQAHNASDANIEIRFERYEHGDGDDFDGAGGTLGHAFFPEFGGDIHMDDSEFWTVDLEVGTNLKFSLVHEIGHSLGLSHSDVSGAIMAPFYQDYQETLDLHTDDIFGIRELYGNFTDRRPPRSQGGSLCTDSTFDTILTTADLNTYVFRGDYYWKLEDYGQSSDNYPRSIEADWGGLQSDIDAGFTTPEDNITYILKEDKIWQFRNQEMISDGFSLIGDLFPGIPNNVDAAYVWSGNGKIYFIKENEYWKFDRERDPPVRGYFPLPVSTWSLPQNITAAMQWKNKKTYFFTDSKFYRFNDFDFDIANDYPAYPRNTSSWWFGCAN